MNLFKDFGDPTWIDWVVMIVAVLFLMVVR